MLNLQPFLNWKKEEKNQNYILILTYRTVHSCFRPIVIFIIEFKNKEKYNWSNIEMK